jgi:SAM-dependent methyltransferase
MASGGDTGLKDKSIKSWQIETPDDLRRYYNERHTPQIVRASERFYRWTLDLAGVEKGRKLIDVGCGGGYLLKEAAERGLATYGLDISDYVCRVARQTSPGSAIVTGNGEQLPFGDACFDYVFNLGNLEHFLHMEPGVQEMARVLADDGLACVLLPNSYYSGDLWRVIRTGYGPTHHQEIERFATVNEWRDLLEGNGLTVRQTIPYNKFKLLKSLFPSTLAFSFVYLCTRSRGSAA